MRVKRSTDRIPAHLMPYLVEQTADAYTPLDHAAWRFIMRIAKDYFKDHAHDKYLDGLTETGIETERIPRIEDMDLCLSQFGWGAVPVSGFIPPTVFLELLSLGILPIAAEMRTLAHLDYTPAPDIVHEAAGHAPIIADIEYAQFLHNCGEMARRVIISRKDIEQFEAIRLLSDLKEDPTATAAQIGAAAEGLKKANIANDFVSEATQLSRFIWWTVEYGLVGKLDAPKIYGAGLLSSVGESYHCLGPSVKKIPLSIDCVYQSYDITEPQPQLFVTPDFPTLSKIATELSETLAYKQGGIAGLEKALQAEATTTSVLDSGFQISGTLVRFDRDAQGNVSYLQFKGPTQLAYQDCELPGHGIATHNHGFGSPLGQLKNTGKALASLTEKDFDSLGWKMGGEVHLEFSSGVEVQGTLISVLRREGKLLIVSFQNCTVRHGETLLFDPSWGAFDMACGERVVSVFGGAADRPKYVVDLPPQQKAKTLGFVGDEQQRELCQIYQTLRTYREKPSGDLHSIDAALTAFADVLDRKFPQDWLSRLEILELDQKFGIVGKRSEKLKVSLAKIGDQKQSTRELIDRGLKVLQGS